MTAHPPAGVHITYSQQYRRCGKVDCSICRAGKPGHGPYWYAYWREDGRVRTCYLGRQAPSAIDQDKLTGLVASATDMTVAPDTLRVRTLEGFQVWCGSALIPPEKWHRRQAGALFKCLLTAPGQRLHREQVVEMLWPSGDPATVGDSLRQAIHALRKIIDSSAVATTHVQMSDGWLTLIPAPGRDPPIGWLDAAAFSHAATQALQQHDATQCRAALALYGGAYLPDDLYDEWAIGPREELQLLYLAVSMHQAHLDAAQGNGPRALRALQRVLAADPCHEAAARAMMRLHALGGRRTEAIKIYHRFAATLRRELDLEPEPETQALYMALQQPGDAVPELPLVERVLAGVVPVASPRASVVVGTPAAGAASAGSNSTTLTNIPLPATTFVGRRGAIVELQRLLGRRRGPPRLVTLTGPGGCGKTRLALHIATRLLPAYDDGIWVVELAGLTNPALVVSVVNEVLGVRERKSGSASEYPGLPLSLVALETALREKRLLLVLDNCEHLLAACRDLVARLLASCPGVRVLATSREPLRQADEVEWRVPPLTCPERGNEAAGAPVDVVALLQHEAICLFVERARAARPGFSLTPDNAAAVVRICQRLDGIPLALELAAARLVWLSVEAIAARLESDFRLLSDVGQSSLPRHQTLRATIDWSCALLADSERAVFPRLGVFAGGWTLEAAQAVCVGEDDRETGGSDQIGVIAPEDMLDVLLRLVAKSLVLRDATVPVGGTVRYRLLEPVRQYLVEELATSGESAAVQRRHWQWCLSVALAAEPELRGSQQEKWLAVLDREQDNLRAALGWAIQQTGDAGEGLQLAAPLLWYWYTRGRLVEGRRWLEQALHAAPSAPADLRAGALNQAGVLSWGQSDWLAATRYHEESLALRRGLHDQRGIAGSLNNLAVVLIDQGEYQRALALHEESLAIKRELGDQVWIASSLTNIGLIARWLGDNQRAIALYEESITIRRATTDTLGLITTLNNLGLVMLKTHQREKARASYAESLTLSTELQYLRGQADALTGLGLVAGQDSDLAQAVSLVRQSIDLACQLTDGERGAWYLEALATILSDHGHSQHAVCLVGAAHGIRSALGVRIPPADQAEHAQLIARLQVACSGALFEVAWTRGNTLSLDAAHAYVVDIVAHLPQAG